MTPTRRPRAHGRRRAGALLAAGFFGAGALAACGGGTGADAHGEDAHPAERGEVKTDPHHVAEERQDCADDVAVPGDALARYGIEVAPARELALTPTVSAPGHLAFPQGAVARVGCAVAGRIAEVRVHSGDAVAAGDTLLVVESPELGEAQSGYLEKRTMAAVAGPALELARQSLERARELHERVQGVSLADLQRREAELRAAEGQREVARAAEAAARNRLLLLGMSPDGIRQLEESGEVEPRFPILAPIGGHVIEISATLGELVRPEKDRLLVVGDLRTLWAIGEVSETRLAEVAIGAPAKVRVPAIGELVFEGRVAALAAVLEASTRTAEVRVELPNPDGTMRPGMFLQVEIESSRGAGVPVLAVPDAAVLSIEGQSSVFVPLAPGAGVFCRHDVEIGAPVGPYVPVLAGLQPGELVVVSGTFRLKAEHGKAAARHEH